MVFLKPTDKTLFTVGTLHPSPAQVLEGLSFGWALDLSTPDDPWWCHWQDVYAGPTQGAAKFMLNLHESFKWQALKGGTLKKVADVVAPAFLGGNISHLTTLRAMYQAFSRAQMFSDDLHSWWACAPLSAQLCFYPVIAVRHKDVTVYLWASLCSFEMWADRGHTS